jgi:hypothetical protein
MQQTLSLTRAKKGAVGLGWPWAYKQTWSRSQAPHLSIVQSWQSEPQGPQLGRQVGAHTDKSHQEVHADPDPAHTRCKRAAGSPAPGGLLTAPDPKALPTQTGAH